MLAHRPQRIRPRAVILGLALIPLTGMWIFGGEMGGAHQRYTFATWAAPFYNAVYILLVLSLANLLVQRRYPVLSFNGLELLTVYAMVSVGSALISSDLQGILVTLMGYPTYFADSSNDWDRLFAGALPDWLMVTDKAAMKAFYKGDSTFFTPEHYLVWLKPIAAWTVFIYALIFMMMCANTILRKAWVERERLSFPIVALPIAMAEDSESFFTNRLMWIGFAAAGAITFMNGLNYLYPSVPYIPVKRVNYELAASGPLAAVRTVRVAFYFFAITLGFLMPLDLSFSLYVFFILSKLEAVAVYVMGTPPESGFPYYTSQAFGAYLAIFCTAVWGLRGYLREVWEAAFGKRAAQRAQGERPVDDDEPMRYRTAIIGFVVSLLVMLFFSKVAGMQATVAVAFFTIYIALVVMITRIRAEFGFPVHDMHDTGPDQTIVRLVGTVPLDRGTMGMFSLYWWLTRVFRSNPMPHQLEAMRMAGSEGGAQRAMFRAVLLAGLVAVPVCFVVYLSGFYRYGAATANFNHWSVGFGQEAFNRLASWLATPALPEAGERTATVFGFGFAMALGALRRRFAGFPLHPLAYAASTSWGVKNLWLPIMIGSWCKALILRGFGLAGYRRAVMLFFGLMLGEFAVGCSWTLYGLIRGIPTYDFWP